MTSSELSRLFTVELLELDEQTGFTRHHAGGGNLLPKPCFLAIVGFVDSSDEYWLEHLDADGKWMTDTWHESIEDAMEQARLEFGISPDRWVSA